MPTLKLTKSIIDDLKASAAEQVYWDLTLRGFGLKVTPAGRKVFIVMYRTNDSRRVLRKYTIGPYGVMTLFSAKAAAQKILLARLDGQDPAAAKQAGRRRPAGLGVEDVIAQYKNDYLEPRAVGGETVRILERVILTRWKGRQITEISRADVRECIDDIIQRGAIAMAARAFKVIRALFNWCVGRGLVEASPCAGLLPPPSGRARDRVLTDDELATVLRTAADLPGHYGPIVTILALTGQRRSEVAEMRWEEVDLEKGIWTIPAPRTKSRRAHVVHLTPQIMAMLPDRVEGQLLVFASPGGKPFQAFSEMKRRHDSVSGVSRWVLHDLRRTAASGMAALGVAPHVADKILNHQGGAISGVTAVYQRYQFLMERKAAAELWSAHVETILGRTSDRKTGNPPPVPVDNGNKRTASTITTRERSRSGNSTQGLRSLPDATTLQGSDQS